MWHFRLQSLDAKQRGQVAKWLAAGTALMYNVQQHARINIAADCCFVQAPRIIRTIYRIDAL